MGSGWNQHGDGGQGADLPTLGHRGGGHSPSPTSLTPIPQGVFAPGHLSLQEPGISPLSMDLNEQVLI